MVHGNGYGHLLRVNGKGLGNSTLGGRTIVELWSELCKQLEVVAVSTEDVSSKVWVGLLEWARSSDMTDNVYK